MENMNSLSLMSSLIIAAAENSQSQGMIQNLLGGPFMMVIIIMGMMYMLWIRPEQKRAKEHREMIQKVKAGDKIVSTSGLHGIVRGVTDKIIRVELAKGVEVDMERAAIGRLIKDTEEK